MIFSLKSPALKYVEISTYSSSGFSGGLQWHTLPNINKIPGFPSASCVLLHPTFIENGWELICTDEANVKILNLVPLTREEHDFAKKTSISVLLDSMAEKNVSLFEPR